ncbi:MAG: type 1 glutamine amidotransferase domain-containing protein [Armatimonadota bacterium]
MELTGRRIALLTADLYEDNELWYPKIRLTEAGAEVRVIGAREGEAYKSKHGQPVTADLAASQAKPADFDAVVIPGGFAPDYMRRNPSMVGFVRAMSEQGKLVAFVCHAGWMAISAGIVKGKRATSFFAIKDDMVNAGALWEDSEVVVDGNLISSRNPNDLPAFCRAIIGKLTGR